MDEATTTPREYEATAHCRDLPELVDVDDEGFSLRFPDGDIDRVVEAVAARQELGARLQEKVDGCWCRLELDDDARVASVTSRAGLHLRVAVGWIGEQLAKHYAGWRIIGEVLAGTHWASEHRDDHRVPLLHVYGAIDRKGREVGPDRLRAMVKRCAHERIVHVREAAWSDDWGSWTRELLEAGAEGVVIRDPRGGIWRAKSRMDADRYVRRTHLKRDHTGQLRRFADLSVCTSTDGKRPMYRRTQKVLVPEGLRDRDLRGRVVRVVGATEDLKTGVIRHARIVDVRPRGEKAPWQCVVTQPADSASADPQTAPASAA